MKKLYPSYKEQASKWGARVQPHSTVSRIVLAFTSLYLLAYLRSTTTLLSTPEFRNTFHCYFHFDFCLSNSTFERKKEKISDHAHSSSHFLRMFTLSHLPF